MVDKELIEIWKKTLRPAISSWLLKTNYEGLGEQEKEEFERDFGEILDLALIGLNASGESKPMSDLIERQVAINAVDAIGHIATMPDGDKCIRRSAVKYTLSMLPPAQPEQRWIPCCERLPEESGYYIVTAHDGVGHKTTFVKYQKKAKSWDLTGARSYWRVIAWMPLPEPYKGGEKDG